MNLNRLPQNHRRILIFYITAFGRRPYPETYIYLIHTTEQLRVKTLAQEPSGGSLVVLGPSGQQSKNLTTKLLLINKMAQKRSYSKP